MGRIPKPDHLLERQAINPKAEIWEPWPNIVASHMKKPYVNTCIWGGSNTEIYNRVLEVVLNTEDDIEYIIIGTTEFTRFRLPWVKLDTTCPRQPTFSVNQSDQEKRAPLEKIFKEWGFSEFANKSYEYLKQPAVAKQICANNFQAIINLGLLAQLKKAKLIVLPLMWPFPFYGQDEHEQLYIWKYEAINHPLFPYAQTLSGVDWGKYFVQGGCVNKDLWPWFGEEYVVDVNKNAHPNEKGSELIAKTFLEKIEINC